MTLESIAPMSDNTTVELPDMAAYRPCPPDTAKVARLLHHGHHIRLRHPDATPRPRAAPLLDHRNKGPKELHVHMLMVRHELTAA